MRATSSAAVSCAGASGLSGWARAAYGCRSRRRPSPRSPLPYRGRAAAADPGASTSPSTARGSSGMSMLQWGRRWRRALQLALLHAICSIGFVQRDIAGQNGLARHPRTMPAAARASRIRCGESPTFRATFASSEPRPIFGSGRSMATAIARWPLLMCRRSRFSPRHQRDLGGLGGLDQPLASTWARSRAPGRRASDGARRGSPRRRQR